MHYTENWLCMYVYIYIHSNIKYTNVIICICIIYIYISNILYCMLFSSIQPTVGLSSNYSCLHKASTCFAVREPHHDWTSCSLVSCPDFLTITWPARNPSAFFHEATTWEERSCQHQQGFLHPTAVSAYTIPGFLLGQRTWWAEKHHWTKLAKHPFDKCVYRE